MPHVIVKLWPGKSEQQKTHLAETIAKDVAKRKPGRGAASRDEHSALGRRVRFGRDRRSSVSGVGTGGLQT